MIQPLRTVVLPAYNESEFIERMLDWTVSAMETRPDPFEIIVVDNASTDSMAEVVRRRSVVDSRITVIVHETNRLYAGSCLTGTKAARGKRIFILDSDGQHDPADVWKFDAALDSGCDIAFGWRRKRTEPKSRLVVSKVLLVLARTTIGWTLHDVNCGIRGFTADYGTALTIEHRVNMVNPELFVRAKQGGFRIDEVEVNQEGRKGGVTSHDFRQLPRTFVDIAKYMLSLRRAERSSPPPR
jgi:glycosyltransferase involved in cell wall biosynthesis